MRGSHSPSARRAEKLEDLCFKLQSLTTCDVVAGEDKNAEPEDQQLHRGADVQEQFRLFQEGDCQSVHVQGKGATCVLLLAGGSPRGFHGLVPRPCPTTDGSRPRESHQAYNE